MDSLNKIIHGHLEKNDKAGLEQLAQEIQHVVTFTKRKTDRTMLEYETARMNQSQAEFNLALVKKAINKIVPTSDNP